MRTKRIIGRRIAVAQGGASLVELMIGLALSTVVISAMVGLMSNSLGSTTRIIQMTQVSDELRNAMSMMSRDLRRANYNANAAYCYSNSDCGVDGAANQTALQIPSDQCMIFNLDRDQDGDATEDGAGGFRRVVDGAGVGFIEMWVGDNSAGCNDDSGVADDDWLTLTDPNIVDIDVFSVTLLTYQESIPDDDGSTLTQNTREVSLQIGGALVIDDTIRRQIDDTIRVRNDFLVRTGP